MKYYERTITKREPINKFGKMGYKPYVEYVKTKSIEKYNKGKRILFEIASDEIRKELRHLKSDVVFEKAL